MPKESSKPTSVPKKRDMSQILKNAYYAIWSVVGLIVIVILAVAVFGSDSWVKNLNIASEAPAAEQPPAAEPQQPPQPTEDQLNCVRQGVGEERFSKLEQGDVANEEENDIIQKCLQE